MEQMKEYNIMHDEMREEIWTQDLLEPGSNTMLVTSYS